MNNILYFIRALFKRGPRFPIHYLQESLGFDLRYGTDTHLRVPKGGLDVEGERRDGILYVASWTSVVRRALTWCESELGRRRFLESQFFDLGCGKGKSLLVYGLKYGVKARDVAIGIEYESALCEIARANINKVGAKAGRLEVYCDSALNISQYVTSEAIIVYLYNPFQGETLRAVLDQLSVYPHLLIYVDPVEKDQLLSCGYNILTFHQGRYNADTWLVAGRSIDLVAR